MPQRFNSLRELAGGSNLIGRNEIAALPLVARNDNVKIFISFVLIAAVMLTVIFIAAAKTGAEEGEKMELTSPEFKHNGFIPGKFTCQGDDINPGLIIEGIPQQAQSLALIIDDPDAPMGTWVHWVVFNISIISRIDENSIPGKQGTNDFARKDYGGPCPPSGTHRYFFKIYALDTELNLAEGTTKQELEEAMQGHILDKAELIGLYKKGGMRGTAQ